MTWCVTVGWTNSYLFCSDSKLLNHNRKLLIDESRALNSDKTPSKFEEPCCNANRCSHESCGYLGDFDDDPSRPVDFEQSNKLGNGICYTKLFRHRRWCSQELWLPVVHISAIFSYQSLTCQSAGWCIEIRNLADPAEIGGVKEERSSIKM